jgi:hypothetical protein
MSKHKQNPVEPNSSETAITKVAVKVVEENQLPETTQPLSEAPPEYAAAINEVKAALTDWRRSTWRFAWALVNFRTLHERVHPGDRLTDKRMAELLGIKLTPARIGQMVNTALAYPREQVDESIDFRVYENARVKYPRATPEKLLKLVKDHPTTAEIAKLKSPGRPKSKKIRRELVIQVTPAVDQDAEPAVKVRLNGEAAELPSNLLHAICKYANEVFADGEKDDE